MIGLPYNLNGSGISELRAYFLDENLPKIEELPIENIDQTKKIVYAITNHFSSFYAGRRHAYMNIDLVKIGNKIGVRLNIFSKNYNGDVFGLGWISTNLMWAPFGLYNAKDVIFWDSPDEVFSDFGVELYTKKSGFIEREYFTVRRTYNPGGKDGIRIYADYNTLSNLVYEDDEIENDGLYEKYFQGYPLVFVFDHDITEDDPNENYYLKVEWALAELPDAFVGSRYTPVLDFSTYDLSVKFNEMASYNNDQNGNRIDDDYEISEGGNHPPNEPMGESPANNAENVSINAILSWHCTDPDDDLKNFDVYFGTSAPPPSVEEFYISTEYDPGTLQNNKRYYWYIVAYDGKDNYKSWALVDL